LLWVFYFNNNNFFWFIIFHLYARKYEMMVLVLSQIVAIFVVLVIENVGAGFF
jgi:hypothetical protein